MTHQTIFGLSHSQWEPIARAVAHGDDVATFDASVSSAINDGYGGHKCIVSLAFRTTSGRHGERLVFVKKNTGREEHHYRHLSGRVPLPDVYGVLHAPDGCEVLVLERLVEVGVDWRSERDVRALLSAMAQLNAVAATGEYAARLPRWLNPYADSWTDSIAALWSRARDGDLGDDLRSLCTERNRLSVERLAVTARRRLGGMHTGLVHWDLIAKNAGWRTNPRTLVLFDLDDVGIAPRFGDAALWLGRPDATRPLPHKRRELATHYLASVEAAGGEPADVDEFLDETSVLWAARELDGLRWFVERSLDGAVAWTADADEGRRVYREWLLERTRDLVEEACRHG